MGVQFDPAELRLALVDAGGGRIGTLSDRIALLCAHLDPKFGLHTGAVLWTMRGLGVALVAAARDAVAGASGSRARHRRSTRMNGAERTGFLIGFHLMQPVASEAASRTRCALHRAAGLVRQCRARCLSRDRRVRGPLPRGVRARTAASATRNLRWLEIGAGRSRRWCCSSACSSGPRSTTCGCTGRRPMRCPSTSSPSNGCGNCSTAAAGAKSTNCTCRWASP